MESGRKRTLTRHILVKMANVGGEFLEMEPRIRESIEIACVIVMQVLQDDILDLVRIYVERTERLHRAKQERPLSPLTQIMRDSSPKRPRRIAPGPFSNRQSLRMRLPKIEIVR